MRGSGAGRPQIAARVYATGQAPEPSLAHTRGCQVVSRPRSFAPPPRLNGCPLLSHIEVPAFAGTAPPVATASAPSSRAPTVAAVPAAASSGQGSPDACGSAILWPGEDEPDIARVLLYTSKRPMHEPI
jgi:hypothetical protein